MMAANETINLSRDSPTKGPSRLHPVLFLLWLSLSLLSIMFVILLQKRLACPPSAIVCHCLFPTPSRLGFPYPNLVAPMAECTHGRLYMTLSPVFPALLNPAAFISFGTGESFRTEPLAVPATARVPSD
jgi:hypothetical protein